MAKTVIVYHDWLKCGRQLSYVLYFIYTYTLLHHGPDFPLAQMRALSNVTQGSKGNVRGQAQAYTSFHTMTLLVAPYREGTKNKYPKMYSGSPHL